MKLCVACMNFTLSPIILIWEEEDPQLLLNLIILMFCQQLLFFISYFAVFSFGFCMYVGNADRWAGVAGAGADDDRVPSVVSLSRFQMLPLHCNSVVDANNADGPIYHIHR